MKTVEDACGLTFVLALAKAIDAALTADRQAAYRFKDLLPGTGTSDMLAGADAEARAAYDAVLKLIYKG